MWKYRSRKNSIFKVDHSDPLEFFQIMIHECLRNSLGTYFFNSATEFAFIKVSVLPMNRNDGV